MAFLPEELRNFSAKGWLGILGTGNRDTAPNNKTWYEEDATNDLIVKPTQIWSDIDLIPPAPTRADAQANAAAFPSLIEDHTLPGTAIHCTPTDANGRTYYVTSTFGDKSTRIRNWIMPQLIPRTDAGWEGQPSYGYLPQVFNGNPDAGGTLIATSDDQVDAVVGWWFNFGAGAISFASSFSNIVDINDIWIQGFRYIGATGGSTSVAGCNTLTLPFINQTHITFTHNLNSRDLLLKIMDDGTTWKKDITSLAYGIQYTSTNVLDVWFLTPTSGTIVVSNCSKDRYDKPDIAASPLVVPRHSFGKNHFYSVRSTQNNDDFRFGLYAYKYKDWETDHLEYSNGGESSSLSLFNMLHAKKVKNIELPIATWSIPNPWGTQNVFVVCQDEDTQDITSMAHRIWYGDDYIYIDWATAQSGRAIIGF